MLDDVIKQALTMASPPQEKDATAAISSTLTRLGNRVFGSGSQATIPDDYTAAYDLGFADSTAARPTSILQVKTGGVHQEDQSVLEFLNDVLYSSYDKGRIPGKYFCMAVLHEGDKNRLFWPSLAALAGDVSIVITPSSAISQHGAKADTWIGASANQITPYTKTQLGQIFSGTQKATYIGLYKRPGTITIKVRASKIRAGNGSGGFDVLLWEVDTLSLTGTSVKLDEWMP